MSGLRLDKHSELDGTVASPRIALLWSPRPTVTVRSSVSPGFRAPQVFDEDLHINSVNGESILISNAPGLRKESSLSVVAGAEWRPEVGPGEKLVEVNGFYTRLRDLYFVGEMDDPATPTLEFERTNLGGAKVAGNPRRRWAGALAAA